MESPNAITLTSRAAVSIRVPVALLGVLVALAACTNQKSAAATTSKGGSASAADSLVPAVLATVGDDSITLADIRSRVGDNLDVLEARYLQQRYTIVDRTLQTVLRDRLLSAEAKKQNKTVDELLAAEVGGSFEPSEIEINAWYQDNQSRVRGRTVDQLRGQIADLLRKERRAEANAKLDARLYKEQKVEVRLQPYRVELNNEGAPAMGPDDAPVTFVEFSDFQCPFCSQFHPTMKQLAQKYGSKLRVVYRQYPIPSLHPNAFKAAEASLCANEQGKFWELHDMMFQEQNQLTISDLKAKAARLSMDQKKFDSCLDSGKYTQRVQDDAKEGSKVGVSGTPALFVNGVEIDGGAVGFDVVSKAIDRELERMKR